LRHGVVNATDTVSRGISYRFGAAVSRGISYRVGAAVSRGISYRVGAAQTTIWASYCHHRQTENGHAAALMPLPCH